MRDYARISPAFWIKGSGRRLRGDQNAQLVALYLATCPTANMVGIFYLPIPTIGHETDLPTDEVRRCLTRCAEVEFAYYDESLEVVWVPNLARYQIGERIGPGEARKRKGIVDALKPYRAHDFYQSFLELYEVAYGLQPLGASGDEHGSSKVLAGIQEGASRVLRGIPCAGARDPAPAPVPDLALGGPGGIHALRDSFVLTDERRAYAEMLSLSNIDGVFKKFGQVAAERQWQFDERGWDARWRRFCDDEVGFQRRERERRGRPGSRATAANVQPVAAERVWKIPE